MSEILGVMNRPESDDDYSELPKGLRDGMRAWIEHGHMPGDFLCAVLSNDLAEASGRADPTNKVFLASIYSWVYMQAPSQCHGSKLQVLLWAYEMAKHEGRDQDAETHRASALIQIESQMNSLKNFTERFNGK